MSKAAAANRQSTAHATFIVERTYAAPRNRVFHALSTQAAKAVWFASAAAADKGDYRLDFRVGGTEHSVGGPPGGPVYSYDATFQDIVPDERIVFTYDMHMDDARISVSLSTVVLATKGKGTTLTYTEQAVFLDGYDTPTQREHGTNELFDALGRTLTAGG